MGVGSFVLDSNTDMDYIDKALRKAIASGEPDKQLEALYFARFANENKIFKIDADNLCLSIFRHTSKYAENDWANLANEMHTFDFSEITARTIGLGLVEHAPVHSLASGKWLASREVVASFTEKCVNPDDLGLVITNVYVTQDSRGDIDRHISSRIRLLSNALLGMNDEKKKLALKKDIMKYQQIQKDNLTRMQEENFDFFENHVEAQMQSQSTGLPYDKTVGHERYRRGPRGA